MLKKISINNIRNIENLIIEFGEINIFTGDNGAGKTSILESIYYLLNNKSFKTNTYHKIANKNKENIIIKGYIDNNIVLINKSKLLSNIIINNKQIRKSSTLAKLKPIQVIQPESTKLITDSPTLRRKFLDWGMFHVKHDYHKLLSEFYFLLKTRNNLIRNKDIKQLRAFESQFDFKCQLISKLRNDYIKDLNIIFNERTIDYSNKSKSSALKYISNIKINEIKNLKNEYYKEDLIRGYTVHGPHRDDIIMMLNDLSVKDYLSSGELKIYLIFLKLSQCELLYRKYSIKSIFLFDDLSAELDNEVYEKLFFYIIDHYDFIQIFITQTTYSNFNNKLNNFKMFHVKHGKILNK